VYKMYLIFYLEFIYVSVRFIIIRSAFFFRNNQTIKKFLYYIFFFLIVSHFKIFAEVHHR
jgi:hypothetical protein